MRDPAYEGEVPFESAEDWVQAGLNELFDEAPGRVRHHDYPTSIAGAVSISYRAGSQKARLLAAYEAWGAMTDEEAATYAGLPPLSCYWKRCNELRQAGLITPTGEERPGHAGVPRIVCRRTAMEVAS